MIIRAEKYKKLINKYALSGKGDEFTYVHARGVYDARILGFCIIRNKKVFKKLKKP